MEKLTNIQLLFLDNLIYLDLFEFESETLKSTIQEIIKVCYNQHLTRKYNKVKFIK